VVDEILDITIGSNVNVAHDAFGTVNSFSETYNSLGKKAGRYIGKYFVGIRGNEYVETVDYFLKE
jgi:hypothetical protein